jgi:DNA-binding GntR family transcriptional regulator
MLAAMARHAPSDLSLRDKVYESLREALTAGRFLPGQKLTFRFVAGTLGVSLTPVREAIRRLAAEGAFEMQPNRSVRLPLLTRDRVLELRDIRMAVEGLAAEKAGARATSRGISQLRRISAEILAVRGSDDTADRQKVREFHFALYGMAGQPALMRVIEGLWLQTGPYMNLLYPEYVRSPRGPATRLRIIKALQAGNGDAARREIEADVHRALTYVADLADAAGNIAPATPVESRRRRGRPFPSPAGGLAFAQQ